MENLTAIEKLDYLLKCFYNNDFEELKQKYGENPFTNNEKAMQVLDRLVQDGYVKVTDYYEPTIPRAWTTRNITFDGSLCYEDGGYTEEHNRRTLAEAAAAQNEMRIVRNERLLVRGTWAAAIVAGFLLLWNVWIWFYPVHKDYPYWFWEKVPAKKHVTTR